MRKEVDSILGMAAGLPTYVSRALATLLVVLNGFALPLSAQNIFQRIDSVLTAN